MESYSIWPFVTSFVHLASHFQDSSMSWQASLRFIANDDSVVWLFHSVFLHLSIHGHSRGFCSGALASVGCCDQTSRRMSAPFLSGVAGGAAPPARISALCSPPRNTHVFVGTCVFIWVGQCFVFRFCSCSVPRLLFLLCRTLVPATGCLRADDRLAQTLSPSLFTAQVS